jgi:propanediol utilization protein
MSTESKGSSRLEEIRIGKLLLRRGLITEEQLDQAMNKQEENAGLRIPSMVGEICVEKGWCTMADVTMVMREQRDEVVRSNTLGRCLLEQGFITQEQLWKALEEHEEVFAPLGEIVVDKGFCTEEQVRTALYLQTRRRSAMSRRLVSSTFDPVNILELVINDEIDGLIADHRGCFCPQCRGNVFAIALNKLPPRYVSDENLIITFSDRYKEEYIDLVRKQIGEAIEKVRTNPKMSCRTKGQALADSFDMAGEVLVKVSNRHVHLSEDHVCVLFGEGHSLTPWKDLLQPGQYAAKEVVSLIGPKGRLDKVRVLGPTRPKTQVEISGTDQFLLGIFAPVKQSGDIEGSPGVVIQGPEGQVAVVHVDTDEANAAGIPAESSGWILKKRLQ